MNACRETISFTLNHSEKRLQTLSSYISHGLKSPACAYFMGYLCAPIPNYSACPLGARDSAWGKPHTVLLGEKKKNEGDLMEVTNRQGAKRGLGVSCWGLSTQRLRERPILICLDSARKEAITQTFPMGLTAQRET